MKRFSIIFLLFILACNSKITDKAIEHSNAISVPSVRVLKRQVYIENLHQDTININGYSFIETLIDDRFYCLFSMQGDTIIKPEDYYFEAELLDIDEDGYIDIRVFVFSNTPNQCDNYLYSSVNHTFKLVENCSIDIIKIKGTDFYYSYERAGCADYNWQSYLSKIKNYELVYYGYIFGQGCDYDEDNNPQVIRIYKVLNSNINEIELIEELPYNDYIKEYGDKWDFIKKYWTRNCKLFEY